MGISHPGIAQFKNFLQEFASSWPSREPALDFGANLFVQAEKTNAGQKAARLIRLITQVSTKDKVVKAILQKLASFSFALTIQEAEGLGACRSFHTLNSTESREGWNVPPLEDTIRSLVPF